MKKWAAIGGVVILLAGMGAWAMDVMPRQYTWRYKMTVVVETPEGIKTGSAVHEMANSEKTSFVPEVGNPADIRGEAIVVDLGERGVLFALISDNSDNRFYDVFPLPGHADGQGGSTPEGIKYHASLPVGTKGVLDPAEPPGYPELVKFTDITDPKSVMLAQIWERQKNGRFVLKEDRMEQLFGKGVKLKEISLEITNEAVTWEIEKWLPWLSEFQKNKSRLNGSTSIAISTNELADNLGTGSFRKGK